MKIPIFFLGTSQAIPTAKRNHTAVLMQYKNENILVDCGEGTQRQFRKAKLNPCRLTRLLITHWHGDHILGIPGLLQTLALNNYNRTLYIYGPRGTRKFIELMYRLFVQREKIKIEVQEVNGKFLETPDFQLEAIPLKHGPPTNAYVFQEKDKIRLDKKKLQQLKLPNSPLLKQLQTGKNIEYNNKIIKASEVTYTEKGKKISFILDTLLTENCYKAAKDADLLIAEATYADEEKQLAKERKHLTASQSALIAKKSKVKQLILSHISQRYDCREDLLLSEAKKHYKNTTIAKDFDRVEV